MIGRPHSVVIDCPDPQALAQFYAELTGWHITVSRPGWTVLDDHEQPGGASSEVAEYPSRGTWRLAFQEAPDLVAPDWPDPSRPQQFHLDIEVADIDVGEQQVLALGARRLPSDGEDFRVYADPAGHPFCLVFTPLTRVPGP